MTSVSGSEDGQIYLWDIQSRNIRKTLHYSGTLHCTNALDKPVVALDIHPTRPLLVAGGFESAPKLYDLYKYHLLKDSWVGG